MKTLESNLAGWRPTQLGLVEIEGTDLLGKGLVCDGCGYKFVVGDQAIGNIDSCCGGGCSRTLCVLCIETAWMAWGRHA